MPVEYETITRPGPRAVLQELRLPLSVIRWAPRVLSIIACELDSV